MAPAGGRLRLVRVTLSWAMSFVVASYAVPLALAQDLTEPTVLSTSITSDPGADDTYGFGDDINVALEIDEVVHVTSPCADNDPPALVVVISVGANSRAASFVGGSGTDMLRFRYTVQIGDLDEDGISIGPAGLVGGCVRDVAGNLLARRLPALGAQSGHRVDAGDVQAPTVTDVSIVSTPRMGDTYGLGEQVRVEVTFDATVHVTGDPILALSVGPVTRVARFVTGSGTEVLAFSYSVRSSDRDDDGISIASNALRDGTIEGSTGRHALRSFGAVEADPQHKVDGGGPERVPVVIVSDAGADDSYGVEDRIEVEVRFVQAVHVTGSPLLALSIGEHTRQARFVSGSGTLTLAFHYRVQREDFDGDGISVSADALTGGRIEDGDGTAVPRDLVALGPDPRHRVNGGGSERLAVAIVSDAGADDTYGRGDRIEAEVRFAQVVHVTGNPLLALSIGENTRQAGFVSGSGTTTLTFHYRVRREDFDGDGVSISANALTGGRIDDGSGTAVPRDLVALGADPRHKVDGGGIERAMAVIVSDAGADETYGTGDRIEVELRFARAMHVTGNPLLALSIGAHTRQAPFLSGSGTSTLTFGYTVRDGDVDGDGISIAANALTGGTLATAGGEVVRPVLDSLPAQPSHKVDARTTRVIDVQIISQPADAVAYKAGEPLEVAVTFEEVVHVTGAPVLTVAVGGASRPAGLVSGSGTATLVFRYTIAEGDLDEDGVSIAANALTGGVIQDGRGNPVVRGFEALAADPAHRVDAGVSAPRVVRVWLSSAPAAANTYVAGESIDVAVTFDRVVHVTGDPVVTLSVGGQSRQAALVSGSGTESLVFRYVVQPGDVDDDGVSVGGDALTGGVIEDADGVAADRSLDGLAAQLGHRVGPEIVVNAASMTLSVGEPQDVDLADLLVQVGARNYGVLSGSSDAPGVVSAAIAGSVMTLTPVAEGMAGVTVTASNARLVIALTVTVHTSAAETAVLTDALATVGRACSRAQSATLAHGSNWKGEAPGCPSRTVGRMRIAHR